MIKRKSRIETILEGIEREGFSLSQRCLDYTGGSLEILYIPQLTDRISLMDFVIKPLTLYLRQRSDAPGGVKAKTVAQHVLYADNYTLASREEEVHAFILDGKVVILLSEDEEYIVLNLKKVERRPSSDPMLEYTLRGPRDCFVENLEANLSLIRYRNKDAKLRICPYTVGKRTRTCVALLYVEDIANDKVVSLMKQRIQAIDVDGIGDSGELEVFLQSSHLSLFPKWAWWSGRIWRSPLQEGKVLVLVDGSGLALSAPKCFPEYFSPAMTGMATCTSGSSRILRQFPSLSPRMPPALCGHIGLIWTPFPAICDQPGGNGQCSLPACRRR